MKAYPEYKDSGIEWLGEVPAHWEVVHLRRVLTTVFNGTTATQVDQSEDTVPVTRIETISAGTINLEKTGHIVREEAPPQIRLVKGDILFSHINSLSMIGNAALFEGGIELYAGMNLLTLRPSRSVQAEYLHWILKASGLRNLISSLAKPAINQASLPQSLLLNIQVPISPLSEQRKIAAFLDREVAKIDDLIEEQRRLIALLAEKRQATISHAVTKGLNPNAKLKPSGIDWLGDVPEGWEVQKLKHLGEAITGLTYSPEDIADQGTLVLRSSNVQAAKIATDDCVYVTCKITEQLRTRVDDILICSRNGSRALIGKNALITSEVAGETWGAFMTVFRSRYNKFLYYVLNSRIFEFQSSSFLTSTINQLTIGNLNSMTVPLPPPEEQRIIIEYLDAFTQHFDNLSSTAEEAITLLQERRSALISAAVTGKIDLRDFDDSIIE